MLDVRRGVLDEPFALAQIRSQRDDRLARAEAPAQEATLVELLQPLRVVDVGLATGHVLGIARVDQEHLEASRFKHLEDGNPIHAGRLPSRPS